MRKMVFGAFLFGFSVFKLFSVSGSYLPTSEVNVTLPAEWTGLRRPLPPLLKLTAADATGEVNYVVLRESTTGLFATDGDEMKLNEESFARGGITSKRQSAVVAAAAAAEGKSGGETENASINLLLTGNGMNCEREKRKLCFWDGAVFRVREGEPPTDLGQLSSPFHRDICNNYTLTYRIVDGNDCVEIRRTETPNVWMLSTKPNLKSEKILLRLNCTVASSRTTDHFDKEFVLDVFKQRKRRVSFESVFEVPPSNVIYEDEKIARGTVSDPTAGGLEFSLANDTAGLFKLECEGRDGKTLYECEVTTKKPIRLTSTYIAYVQVETKSSHPHERFLQNITLTPADSGLEKLSLMLSTNPEENFMLDLKYPESVTVSKRAIIGSRIAEPLLGDPTSNSDVRKKVVASNIRFEILSPGIFNVTQSGGIVFVSKNQLKEGLHRIKISGIYPNGYKFISTMQINVTDPKLADDPCDKSTNDSNRPSCSEKKFKSDCEKTCGVASGFIKRRAGKPTTGCTWRSNNKPEKLSRLYQTCSPDLSTCPDRYCDPLEVLFPKICPQDCTEYVFGSANKENHSPGIASATGVCSCDSRQKCLCSLLPQSDPPKPSERRKSKELINDTVASRQKEAISAVKASYADNCGVVCLLSIVAGSVIVIFGTSAILIVIYRRRLKKRCPNQRPLKEDMVNINYEEYVERPGDILRPLTQASTVKEIPEYFDKKWEFPRHRLTIEETLGEGEFGKVLKARADGIGGYDGSTTVAVKTLKDNAKESELADLISEYQLLKEIDHPNVIHLLGACTKMDGPLYIIIEYAKHGSLRNYLRKHRHLSAEQLTGKESETSYVQTITPNDILTFAWQIAKGMNYLTEMKLVHRDLAARNVLVAEGLICKISDFGLTRDIYEDDTYLKRSKGRVPVKWMALESLADHVYTTKSDVWSYGIVLWELVTTGASPYPGIAGQDLFNLLKSGYRMEKPPNCSTELYQILRSCWQENPSHRPTFKSLVAKFEEMLGEGKDYLDLNPRTAENKTYFSEFLWDEKDERETFGGEMCAMKFKMFENPKCNCPVGMCSCEVKLRYENQNVAAVKPKYENDGMEDTGYVQPVGKPKPVNECLKCGEDVIVSSKEITSDANFNVENNKKEIFETKKI